MSRNWILIGVALLAWGCDRLGTKPKAPEDPIARLTDYISKSFVITRVEEKNDLLGFLTDQAAERLAKWDDDQFREAFVETKRTFVKLAIDEVKSLAKDKVNITYQLTYLDQKRGHDAKITHKKLCQMIQKNGAWFVRDVQSLKEWVEFKNEMTLP